MRYRVTRRILSGTLAGLDVEAETDVEFEAGREYYNGVLGSRYLIVEVRERTMDERCAGLDPEDRALVAESEAALRRAYSGWVDRLDPVTRDWVTARDAANEEGRRRAALRDWHIEDWRRDQEEQQR